MLKKNAYFLLMAIMLGLVALFGKYIGFIDNDAILIVLVVLAGASLLTYLGIKYYTLFKLRKKAKELAEMKTKRNKNYIKNNNKTNNSNVNSEKCDAKKK